MRTKLSIPLASRRPSLAGRVLLVAVVALTAALGLGGFGPANAASPEPSTADIEYVRAALGKYDLSPETQQRLLNDFIAGKVWDSQSGAVPISTETSVNRGVERTIYRYADGSIMVSDMDLPVTSGSGRVGTDAISGCVLYYQRFDVKRWNNCKVSWDAVSWSMAYTAAYGIYQFGSDIESLTGLTFGGAGSLENPVLEIVTKYGQGRSSPAVGQGKVTQHCCGVFARTVGVKVEVRADWGGGRSSSI